MNHFNHIICSLLFLLCFYGNVWSQEYIANSINTITLDASSISTKALDVSNEIRTKRIFCVDEFSLRASDNKMAAGLTIYKDNSEAFDTIHFEAKGISGLVPMKFDASTINLDADCYTQYVNTQRFDAFNTSRFFSGALITSTPNNQFSIFQNGTMAWGPQLSIFPQSEGSSPFVIAATNYDPGKDTIYYPIYFKASEFNLEEGNLNVNGTITCKNQMKVTRIESEEIRTADIKVDMNHAADYVFDNGYKLEPLTEVEQYVKSNKHLPGFPSAAEMAEKGVSLSEMSNMLLEKVEELTLHMIEMQKQIKQLQEENEALKANK